jgi:hypothetical protein
MRLISDLMDSVGTVLADSAVPQIHRRDGLRQLYLMTDPLYTPLGFPITFEVDIGPKGRGLTVQSVDAVMLTVSGFDAYHEVRLRLPTEEIVRITLYDR